MTDNALSGAEHLMTCLETLHDLSAQLLGDPISVIESIRRSGVLVPASGLMHVPGLGYEERERAAEERLNLLLARKERQDALQRAICVIQSVMRDHEKAESPAVSAPSRAS